MGVELLQRQVYSPAVPLIKKQSSPFLATFLSLICPGLGAAYNGQTAKALTFFAVFAGLFQLAATTHGAPIFVFGFLGIWIYAAIDAFRMAQMRRQGITPNDAEDLLMKRLSGNPVLWGIILTVLGVTFILQMFGGLRLPLREMLPVLFIGFGVYLLWNFWRKRAERKAWNEYGQPPVSGEIYSDLDEVTAFRAADYSSRRTGSWK